MSEACPCGAAGCSMPEPVERFDPASAVEAWLKGTGWTIAELKRPNRRPDVVEMRRRVARYLDDHGMSEPQIGEFLDRDHSTVHRLLTHPPRPVEEVAS